MEREIIAALRSWYSGYHVRIDATGYEEELDDCRARLDRLAREEDKLKTQLDNAHDLVEQGVYPGGISGAQRKACICARRTGPRKGRHWRRCVTGLRRREAETQI